MQNFSKIVRVEIGVKVFRHSCVAELYSTTTTTHTYLLVFDFYGSADAVGLAGLRDWSYPPPITPPFRQDMLVVIDGLFYLVFIFNFFFFSSSFFFPLNSSTSSSLNSISLILYLIHLFLLGSI